MISNFFFLFLQEKYSRKRKMQNHYDLGQKAIRILENSRKLFVEYILFWEDN